MSEDQKLYQIKLAIDASVDQDSNEIDTFTPSQGIDKFQDLFHDEEAFGSILYIVFLRLFGKNSYDWEPETIILTLRERYPEIPDVNIDKLMAFASLDCAVDGSLNFHNEVNCFRHTVNALNNTPPNYRFLGALVPQFINWAMYEVEQLHPEYKLDEEPAKFLGLSYHVAGHLVLPDRLAEYQMFLDAYNKNTEIVEKVKEYLTGWETKDVDSIEDDLIGIQMLHLKADKAYMDHKIREYRRALELYT